MRNRILSMVLLVVFILAAAVGCGKDGFKKQVKTSIENLSKAKSYELTGEIGIKVDTPTKGKINPEEEMFSQIFKDIKIKFNGKYNKSDVEETSFDLSVPFNNLDVKINGFQKGDDIWIRYPMLPNYIHLNANDLNKEQKTKNDKASKEIAALLFKLQDQITSSIKDDKFTSSKGTTTAGESVNKITVKLNKEDLLLVIKAIYDFTESPEFKNSSFYEGDKTEENKKEYEEFIKEFKDSVEINDLSFTFGINDNLLKEQQYNIDLKVKDKDTKEVSNIKFTILLTYSKINQGVKIEFPDFKKEGVTEYKDLMKEGGLFGPGLGDPSLQDPSAGDIPKF